MRRLSLLVFGLPVLLACGKKEPDVTLAPSASGLAPSMAASSSTVVKYSFDPKGETAIDMPAPDERIKAKTTAAAGTLDVDLANFSNTRGEVKVDLTTLTTFTFPPEKDKDNKAQTEHAHNWLEVGTAAAEDVRQANKWAVFAIRSIDGLSATDASKIAPAKDGAGEVRTVTLTAHGEILVHGRKQSKDAKLEVRLQYAPGAKADSKPSSLVVKTLEPLKVTLAEHDVKPRDTQGKIAQKAFGLLGKKVADVASITFELRATTTS